MLVQRIGHVLVGMLVLVRDARSRDERGLTQSTETAILIAAAVAVAMGILGAVTVFVTRKLAALG
jgi:protein-S-isoprenylcysteine O-methyltransferase Ste14